MKRNKLLLLLVLLMTAATGAWATNYTTLAVGDVIKVGDTFSPTADGAFYNEFGVSSDKTYTLIRADVDNDYNVTEKTDGAYYVFKYASIMSSPYIHFEKAFAVTAISDGLVVTNIETIMGKGTQTLSYTLALHESAAPAPAGYTVSLKDGTDDAGNWKAKVGNGELQALPLTGLNGGETVTITYSGTKRVKSVKAVKKEVIKPDLLSGVFSVSASKKVNFSKGNLQATYDGSSWTWAFANNQWDYIGNSAGNTKVTDASPFISENGTVDLFGWVGASSTWDGVNQYGITSSKARNATNGYGNSATENLKYDWGTLMGTGWRTLTKDEWAYMLNSRSGTSYCKAQVNSKSGLVIFPDGYTHPTGPTAPTNTNTTNAAYTTNSWSGEAWTKMENAGCVFLPAAGNRDGNSVSNAGTAGTYWWSTHYEGGGDAVDRAYNLYFTNNFLLPTAGSYRNMGCSVRLVREVTE